MPAKAIGGDVVQFGVLMIAMSLHSLYLGSVASGLFCLSGGLLLVSVRKSELGMKVTWKNLVTPVDDTEEAGPLEAAMRFASYAVFLVAMVVAVAGWLEG